MSDAGLKERFIEKAQFVSAYVTPADSFEKALVYAVDVCERKEACQLLVSGCELPVSDTAQALCETKQQKIVAAPALDKKNFTKLSKLCAKKGLACLETGMRDHVAGIDVGISVAEFGLAETGTCVVVSDSEEVRLASMLCETHVIILPVSRLRESSFDIQDWMVDLMKKPPSYLAFVTGASRTADIERVLALGVHGPLELHVVLVEDNGND